MLGVLFSSERCVCVFLENLAYHADYQHFSPGMILYDHYLKRLVEKGKCALFTGGGDWEYKRRYGAVCDLVYEGRIYRNAAKMKLLLAAQNIRHWLGR